jgi:outer membrane protein assembly factor BamB
MNTTKCLTSALFLLFSLPAIAQESRDEFLAAARKGEAKKLEALLAKGADVNAKSDYGATALHFAADKGHLEVVKLLLKYKADVNAKDTFYQATPMTWAVYRGHVEVIKALLEAGANADEALPSAMSMGKTDVIRAILEKGKLKPETLSAALTSASSQKEILELLKKAGAKPAPPPTTKGADRLPDFAGTYDNSEGIQIKLAVKEGQLVVLFQDKPLYTLTMIDDVTFKPAGDDESKVTFKREGDKVVGFVMKTPKTEVTYKRIDPAKEKEAEPKPIAAKIDDRPIKVTTPRNWPSFRGPNASGIGDGQFPPTAWNATNETNVFWKTAIPGFGHSSPVVWNERIFVTTAVSGDTKAKPKVGLYGDVDSVNDQTAHTWRVFCLDKRGGKILWEQTCSTGVPKVKRHMKASHANPTPAVDDRHVVASFGSEGIYCYNHDGKLLWKRDLGVLDSGWFYDPDYQWGFGSSPIIFRDRVIVQCDVGKNSFIAAYDLDSGKELWLTRREEIPSWGTPTMVEASGHIELVTNATKFIRGYDPMTGKELWRLGKNAEITVPTPIFGQGLIYVTSGYRPIQPIYAIRPGAKGDISLPEKKEASDSIAWSKSKGGPYMPTPIVYCDYLYTCSNAGIVTCYEAKTGKQVYQKRLGGSGGYTASPVAADGRLYFTGEEGEIRVIKAGPTFELLAVNKMADVCMATPAIADGMIFVRTQQFLYGIGRKETAKGN